MDSGAVVEDQNDRRWGWRGRRRRTRRTSGGNSNNNSSVISWVDCGGAKRGHAETAPTMFSALQWPHLVVPLRMPRTSKLTC